MDRIDTYNADMLFLSLSMKVDGFFENAYSTHPEYKGLNLRVRMQNEAHETAFTLYAKTDQSIDSDAVRHIEEIDLFANTWFLEFWADEAIYNRGFKQEYVILIGLLILNGIMSTYIALSLFQKRKDKMLQEELNEKIEEVNRSNEQMQIYTDKLENVRLEQMDAADQLKVAKDKAEKANEAKSEFLANMSHELRTPLNSIMRISKMLTEDSEEGTEERDMVETVHKSASSLLNIVNDILDISKIEAGEVVLENISFDFEDLVNNVVSTLSPLASAKGVWIQQKEQENTHPYLLGDPTRLSRILTNLVGNAIKYTLEGGVMRFCRKH